MWKNSSCYFSAFSGQSEVAWMDEIKLDWLSQTDKCLRMKLFLVCFRKTKHCIQTVFRATQVFRQTHEWLQWTYLLFCPDRKCFHLCAKHPRTNKPSWAPDPYEQISNITLHVISGCSISDSPNTPFFPADWKNLSLDDKTANKMLWISEGGSKVCRRTEEVCPVLDRPERYEYSPQVRHTRMHLDDVYWRKHITLFLFRSLKGVVQRGNLEDEGLLGGGVLRLGGNWSHIWRSREEGECWAQWPWRKRGVLGSLLVRNAVRDLVQWYQERHKQCPFLLCDWSLPWPACRDYQLLCRNGRGSRTRRSTVVQSGDINGSKDSPWFLDWDSVFLHHTQETWMKCLKSYTFNCLIIIYLEMTVIKWFTAILLSLFWNMFFEK